MIIHRRAQVGGKIANKLLKRNKKSWPSLCDYSQPFYPLSMALAIKESIVTNSELKLLQEYLDNPDLIKSELSKNQGIKNLFKVVQPSKADSLKMNPPDFVEIATGIMSYYSPQLIAQLEIFICNKWNYCKEKDKYHNGLAIAIALSTAILNDAELSSTIKSYMPVVLCVAGIIQTNKINKLCNC